MNEQGYFEQFTGECVTPNERIILEHVRDVRPSDLKKFDEGIVRQMWQREWIVRVWDYPEHQWILTPQGAEVLK